MNISSVVLFYPWGQPRKKLPRSFPNVVSVTSQTKPFCSCGTVHQLLLGDMVSDGGDAGFVQSFSKSA
jgi:hypothetical protein